MKLKEFLKVIKKSQMKAEKIKKVLKIMKV